MVNPIFDSVSGIISDSDHDHELTLEESFAKLAEGAGRGWVNATRLQREVVSYVGMRCGGDIKQYLDPQNRRYQLKEILMDARDTYVPYLSDVKTIRRWVYYFAKYRRTMAAARERTFIQTRNIVAAVPVGIVKFGVTKIRGGHCVTRNVLFG